MWTTHNDDVEWLKVYVGGHEKAIDSALKDWMEKSKDWN
jgi:hypothetical protein